MGMYAHVRREDDEHAAETVAGAILGNRLIWDPTPARETGNERAEDQYPLLRWGVGGGT
jgi:hypothetical protein